VIRLRFLKGKNIQYILVELNVNMKRTREGADPPPRFRRFTLPERESDQERYAREYQVRLRREEQRQSVAQSMEALRVAEQQQEHARVHSRKRTRDSNDTSNKRMKEANPIDVIIDALWSAVIREAITYQTVHKIKHGLAQLHMHRLNPEQQVLCNQIYSTIQVRKIHIPKLHKTMPIIKF